jgi:hypothetical protein
VDGAPVVDVLGDNVLTTDINGRLTVKNLAPGKYGVVMVAPQGTAWQQTTTIEGTKLIDAWVKADEPNFFNEFAGPGVHVFMGFVLPTFDTDVLGTGSTIKGSVVNLHTSRPPDFTFFEGVSNDYTRCWVALNDLGQGAIGKTVYAQPCDDSNSFSIPGVPEGSYQLAVWDKNMDQVIGFYGVNVIDDGLGNLSCSTPNGSCDLQSVGVFNWFGRMQQYVFNDDNDNGIVDPTDANGFWDEGERGILEQGTNIRWRDGTIYQQFPTDLGGAAPYDTVFPFFHWLVAEVDFAAFKATGMTSWVDAGGPIDPTDPHSWGGVLTPQLQFCTQAQVADGINGCAVVGAPIVNNHTGCDVAGDVLCRTETGPVLTQPFQDFLGQSNVITWGKKPYQPGENGGISGIVYYATTRAEDDPRITGAEVWEPGIPRVQVNLYQDDLDNETGIPAEPLGNGDGIIDDRDGNGCWGLADADNAPFDSPATPFPGPEDVDRSWTDGGVDPTTADACIEAPGNGTFDLHDAIMVGTTDSWDDSLPTGCQGDIFYVNPQIDTTTGLPVAGTGDPTDCYDGLRNFNQVRDGVFDGGFAFGPLIDCPDTGAGSVCPDYAILSADPTDPGYPDVGYLNTGGYITEAATPPGYTLVKEEDRNVDFGADFIPAPELLPVPCVGDERPVPQYLSFVTKDGSGTDPGNGSNLIDPAYLGDPDVFAPFTGEVRPFCDRKKTILLSGQNAGVEFFMFTQTPIAAQAIGFILDDAANEFDPTSPAFGEKFSPPWLPVSIRDWKGREIDRIYSDRWGKYNFMAPSTFTQNLPYPSGISPQMLITCKNDPVKPDGTADPWFNSQYSQFCYTFQYMPGTTTYLDTPVLPVAAFAGPSQFPLDCQFADGTPKIYSVSDDLNGVGGGPYVPAADGTHSLTILSEHDPDDPNSPLVKVQNPAFDGNDPLLKLIERDFGFGASPGTVTVGGVPLTVTAWGLTSITATVPAGVSTGQLVVTRGDNGNATVHAVTLTVGPRNVIPVTTTIQAAIDSAVSGDIVMVPTGLYEELVVMWKPVQLQGWGPGSTTISAVKFPGTKLEEWRDKVQALIDLGAVSLLPGQEPIVLGAPEIDALINEQGPAVFVMGLAKNDDTAEAFSKGGFLVDPQKDGPINARIDGFTLRGGDASGGVIANGYTPFLEVSNNQVVNNQGNRGGGIRFGHSDLVRETNQGLVHTDSVNDNPYLHNNHVWANGTLGGVGGGIALYTGADDYVVAKNYVCGNFSAGHAGGIGQLGLVEDNDKGFLPEFDKDGYGGAIVDNLVIFNQSFNQGINVHGGGITIAGKGPADLADTLGPGSGPVRVERNLIQGNLAGAGEGGGMALFQVDGVDADKNRSKNNNIRLVNNMIVNNVAGLAGGGISLQDALNVDMLHMTVANNDSTATAGAAFLPGSPNISTPQPAGIVSRAHSTNVAAEAGAGFSDPVLLNSIVWHNRTFNVVVDTNADPQLMLLKPDVVGGDAPLYWDMAVLGASGFLSPDFSVLTSLDDTTYVADPTGPVEDVVTLNQYNTGDNLEADPLFVAEYVNGNANAIAQLELNTGIAIQPAFDEGGNFIDVRFGPITRWCTQPLIDIGVCTTLGELNGDYHIIQSGSPATTAGTGVDVADDIDGDPRVTPDRGADEI